VLNRQNLDGIAVIMEANAIRADAQSTFRRFYVPKMLDVAFVGFKEARQPVKDLHRGLWIDGAEVGLGARGPGDFLGHSLVVRAVSVERQRRAAHSFEVVQCKAELGKHFLVRDGLVVLQPLLRLGDS